MKPFFLLGVLALSSADLPIHCIHDQIFGEWEIEMTPASNDISKCGYESPDRNAQHFTSYKEPDYSDSLKSQIKISAPATLEVTSGSSLLETGSHGNSWTLVYDEGLEFKVGDKKMFAYFQYAPKEAGEFQNDDIEGYNSNCAATRTGWYHTSSAHGRKYGCWRATQTQAQNPGMNSQWQGQSLDQEPLMVSPSSFMGFDALIEKHEVSTPDAKFRFNQTFIDQVNSDPESTWTAKAHEDMHNKMTMSEAYKKLGRRVFNKGGSDGYDRRNYHKSPTVLMETMTTLRSRVMRKAAKKQSMPTNFNWQNHMRDMNVVDQGDCGSCYAVAASKSFAMRLAIKNAEQDHGSDWWKESHGSGGGGGNAFLEHDSDSENMIQFGHQHEMSAGDVLQCSTSNQGCAGGYPYLVGWFGDRRGMQHQENSCQLDQRTSAHHPTKFEYIGGHYGAATEQKLMEDIWNHGPAVIAIDAPSSLFSYNSGVFRCENVPHEGTNLPDLHPWEKTNHALVAVGWGEDGNGQRYWRIMNSWGRNWGDNGFFNMERGGNACAIASMPVSIQP